MGMMNDCWIAFFEYFHGNTSIINKNIGFRIIFGFPNITFYKFGMNVYNLNKVNFLFWIGGSGSFSNF